jgi:hypothetical protein
MNEICGVYLDPGHASFGVESHHITPMQLKHILAAALAVLLLCVPSWASVCELSCSLSRSYPAPHLARASSNAQPEHTHGDTPRSHCGHVTSATRGGAAAQNIENASKCMSAPCTQAAVLSSPVNGQDGVRMASGPLSAFAVLPHADALITEFSSAKREAARPKLLPPDSRPVSLRI